MNSPLKSSPARNSPCPCGSGKRFKQCHGFDSAAPQPRAAAGPDSGEDIARLLQEGLQHQEAGRISEAASAFRKVLDIDPNHPDAWHLLALVDLAQGSAEQAQSKVERAIAVFPDHLPFHLSRVRIEISLGQDERAAMHARNIADLWPESGAGWTLLGICLAASSPDRAEDALRRAIRLNSSDSEAYFELARLLQAQGRDVEAITVLRTGIEHSPDDVQLLNRLALLLEQHGQASAAEDIWQQAHRIAPAFPLARANLGRLLFARGKFAEARAMLEPPASELGESFEYWLTLAFVRQELGLTNQAIKAFLVAKALRPDDLSVDFHLGSAYFSVPLIDEALAHLRRITADRPEYEAAQIMISELARRRCDWVLFREAARGLQDWVAHAETLMPPPHAMVSLPLEPAGLLRVAVCYSKCLGEPAPKWKKPMPARSGARLRLAYLTSAVREHPTPTLITEVLERHDRDRFEVFLYSCGPREDTPYRRRIEAAVEHFIDFATASDEEILGKIRCDDLDILLDVDGHTQNARNRLLAKRPAPVQVNYLGFPGTLGTQFHDYIITDRVVTPGDEQRHFTERFAYMPHCYFPSDTRRRSAATSASRAQCALPEKKFVFCSFNHLYKLLPEMFEVWMHILRESPNSVLWMIAHDPFARENLRREAASRGIDPDRLVFSGPEPAARHLARYPLADLFLDGLPCNAHTTCNDALLMGLPVLTCIGNTFSGRVAASQVGAAGLAELVTPDLKAYAQAAIALARDPGLIARSRNHLAREALASPLFDMGSYTRHFEELLAGLAGS